MHEKSLLLHVQQQLCQSFVPVCHTSIIWCTKQHSLVYFSLFKLLGYKDELAVCPALPSPASKQTLLVKRESIRCAY